MTFNDNRILSMNAHSYSARRCLCVKQSVKRPTFSCDPVVPSDFLCFQDISSRVMPSKHDSGIHCARKPSGMISSTYCPRPKIRGILSPVAHWLFTSFSSCFPLCLFCFVLCMCSPFSSHNLYVDGLIAHFPDIFGCW